MIISRRCCRKSPFGNDLVAIATIATSLIVIVIYYVSPPVEKGSGKVDHISRGSQSQVLNEEISDIDKEKLRQQIDEFDEA